MSRILATVLVTAALVAAAILGYWGGARFGCSPAEPVTTAGTNECQELQEELAAAKADMLELEDRLAESETLVQNMQLDIQSLETDLSESKARVEQLGVLGKQAALGLSRVLLDELLAGKLEAAAELADGEDVELYVQHPDREDYGFASEDHELWNSLMTWLAAHEPQSAPGHFFLEGYSDFHNVVFELPEGFVWFQFSDDWLLVKIRASLEDPRESSV